MVSSSQHGMSSQEGKRKRMPRAEREQQMIAVAVEVFAEHGFLAASMDDIAARVGVSKPMLYEYFDSKEGLLVAALRHARTELHRTVEQALADASSAEDALRQGLLAYFTFMAQRRQAWSLLRQELGALGPAAAEEVETIRRQQTQLHMRYLRHYAPYTTEDEIEVAAEIIVGGCERLAAWCDRHHGVSPERATQYAWNVIWGGLSALGAGDTDSDGDRA
ncbi:TetR/AcrR family transcriptional regulator [Thermocrispum agreste]|jgi:AcrR family transcriptional regulator|uniref:TetR/AcrR family transcriptional regulator n=3 Tax=Thermocrispum TaxID=37924 RepID=A0ABD6FD80_9PSEU|nr:TetR/AcrR family transcriptional regulator [Thermocrispum agreste]